MTMRSTSRSSARRTISAAVRHFASPECFLGIFPAWGGTQLIPRLVGAQTAVKFAVENAMRQNTMLNAQQAFEVGFADLSYFNRTFRRRYNATPSDIRNNARN